MRLLNAYRHLILKHSSAGGSKSIGTSAQRLSASNLETQLLPGNGLRLLGLLNAYRHLILKHTVVKLCQADQKVPAQRLSASNLETQVRPSVDVQTVGLLNAYRHLILKHASIFPDNAAAAICSTPIGI